MERDINRRFLEEGYTISAIGVYPSEELTGVNILKGDNGRRLARFLSMFRHLEVATTGNVLALRTDMFIPCGIKKFQELSKLKDKAFKYLITELQEKHLIKIEDGIIYVNPLFAMSKDMDFLRFDLRCRFPEYEDAFKRINEDLRQYMKSLYEDEDLPNEHF